MSVAVTGGAIAAAAAAKKKRRLQEEEERLTNYNNDDLKDWEFKIVRSVTEKFKSHEAVQKLCAEEAQAGWEMVEKFDNGRIRFKRRIECRSRDGHLQIDPYRTNIGFTEGSFVMVILGVIALTGGVAFLLFRLMD
ncbi:MAG: hypothetical protein KOO62_11655 [candidate division Zixibacteria bacterium]|nr:hypothetical protein [candidate division Zixibacteria bacterium]